MSRPRVSTNLAISADGKISSTPPCPAGWTSREDHTRLLLLRRNADAILVGRGTLESDRMTMTVPGASKQPLRCIVTRRGVLNPAHPVLSTPGGKIHLLVTGPASGPAIPNVTVHHATLLEFLNRLGADFGVRHLHCEGGGQLIRELAELDVIDDFHVTLAGHTLFGGFEAATATGLPAEFLPRSADFMVTGFTPQAGECFMTYTRRR